MLDTTTQSQHIWDTAGRSPRCEKSTSGQGFLRCYRKCQRWKTGPRRRGGLLQPIQSPTQTFRQLGTELLRPFPLSSTSDRWIIGIIVATECITLYAGSKALPYETATEVANFFMEHILLRHGVPEVVIADRGTAFISRLTQGMMRLSPASHCKTMAQNPQAKK